MATQFFRGVIMNKKELIEYLIQRLSDIQKDCIDVSTACEISEVVDELVVQL